MGYSCSLYTSSRFPLAANWLWCIGGPNEALLLVWDAQRKAMGIPSIFT